MREFTENCEEQVWENLSDVEAIPLSGASFSLPLQIEKSTLAASEFSVTESQVVKLFPDALSIKASDSVKDTVSGRLHTVSVSFHPIEKSAEMLSLLDGIATTPHHLRLTFWNGRQAIVRATRDSYSFIHFHGEDGYQNCQFNIQDCSGVQFIL